MTTISPKTLGDLQPIPNEAPSEGSSISLFTEREAARFLRLSPRSLHRLRVAGGGPAFIRAGPRRILYARDALLSWLESRTFQSAAQEGDALASGSGCDG